MTAVLQSFSPHSILLNPSPRPHTFPLPHPASYTSLSSASSSTDDDALYSSSTDADRPRPPTRSQRSSSVPARKIRFAPLPDPRRAVFVTDGGDELPIPVDNDAGNITAAAHSKKFTIGPTPTASPSVSPQLREWEVIDSPRLGACKLPPPLASEPPSLASSVSSASQYDYSAPPSPNNATCFPAPLPKKGLTSKLWKPLLMPMSLSKKPSLNFANTSTESVGLSRSVFSLPVFCFRFFSNRRRGWRVIRRYFYLRAGG
ncbi:hypothetical protein NEOLEDRAFT_498203 [Neolentinus lepideus HHB14362 ss-1]|uniref:Uncharacterized protein n=1 Tax=Neolentinus lepideus HHB14362 ss-1 TaxID=1314782 RepID=A0A165RP13_9AGAM|nr:hypothetical protein NEOLEDRAFT_498203 [Neolentinus lepideus HHB14362 ss-1]